MEVGGDEVTIQKFHAAVTRFQSMLKALSTEIAGSRAQIDWVLESLEIGSALQRYQGIARRPEDVSKVPEIADEFEKLTKAYARGERPLASDALREKTEHLLELIDKETPYLRFETRDEDAKVEAGISAGSAKLNETESKDLGAVEGRVQTLSSRGSLRFTLYDLIFDKAVSCYLNEDQREITTGIWGRLAIVEGLVTRDARTGRPYSIRQVTNVELLDEVDVKAYLRAEGIAPSLSNLSPEDAIRRIRDVS